MVFHSCQVGVVIDDCVLRSFDQIIFRRGGGGGGGGGEYNFYFFFRLKNPRLKLRITNKMYPALPSVWNPRFV